MDTCCTGHAGDAATKPATATTAVKQPDSSDRELRLARGRLRVMSGDVRRRLAESDGEGSHLAT